MEDLEEYKKAWSYFQVNLIVKMGRIKSTQIKRVSRKLVDSYIFTDNFDENKKLVSQRIETSKKTRNSVAGYITRLVKQAKVE